MVRKEETNMKWNITLDEEIALRLRESVDTDEPNLKEVLNNLKDAYYWIANQGTELYDETDAERDTEDFDFIDDNEEAVDYELDKFFDVCDALRIWVPTHETKFNDNIR